MAVASSSSLAPSPIRRAATAHRTAPHACGASVQTEHYGRRGKGYVFGAFRSTTGAALTATLDRRSAANYVDSLGQADVWLPDEAKRIYAIVDNLNTHQGTTGMPIVILSFGAVADAISLVGKAVSVWYP